ncbi:MAG TPA: GNAT family N-acetyltransferase [Rectinemataceae bacterium]|nr:GNAT family N-acetyltransferase [Rectinemataceae bacterium]
MRIAEARDAAAMAEIYRPYVEGTSVTFEEEAPSAEEMASRIARVGSAYPWLVHEEGGRVLGYAYASKHRERAAYRWSLETSVYVREDCRGRGIGSALYASLIPLLRELGIVNLYGVITLPNPGSLALHAKFGFAPLCTFRDVGYKGGGWRDVGWMVLALRDPGASPAEPAPFPEFARAHPETLRAMLGQPEA